MERSSASALVVARILVIAFAHTIFYEIGAERRAAMRISESLIRVSIGIEDTVDLVACFHAGIAGWSR